MSLTPSQRHTREWPLLVLSVALVFAVCIPLKQWLASQPAEGTPWAGRLERGGRLLLGPEQIACFCCFTWGGFILLSRYLELRPILTRLKLSQRSPLQRETTATRAADRHGPLD